MAEACTATGGANCASPLRTGAATPKFRLQPDAQSAVRRGASIGITVSCRHAWTATDAAVMPVNGSSNIACRVRRVLFAPRHGCRPQRCLYGGVNRDDKGTRASRCLVTPRQDGVPGHAMALLSLRSPPRLLGWRGSKSVMRRCVRHATSSP
jgi:hypothetical protein